MSGKIGRPKICPKGDPLRHCAKKPAQPCGAKKCTGRPTAPVMTRYRCFLPDLAGLAGLRRVGPGTRPILTSSCRQKPTAALLNPRATRAPLFLLVPKDFFTGGRT